MSTRVAELGIACEACHGPAAAHVDAQGRLGDTGGDDIVDPGSVPGARASEICAQCHAITVFHDDAAWVRAGHDGTARDPLARTVALVRHPARDVRASLADALEDEEPGYFAARFWSDGVVRVSGREYNGIVESACARDSSFGCLSCHSMHASAPDDQLRRDRDPDDACVGCHPALAADVSAHGHHARESAGSRCVNCHQPHTTYGLLGAMRSHTIDRPSVRASLDTGRPNACNLCHLDRTLAWTASALSRWYGQPVPEDLPPERGAAALAWLEAGDAGQRALLAWHFAWPPALAASGVQPDRPWTVPWLAELLGDEYHAVRWVAARALRRTPGFEALPLGGLDDEGVPPARAWARDRWQAQGAPEPPEHAWPQPHGDMATFMASLLEHRDDRPIELAE